MAKLYFRYGTVNAAKSMNMLNVCHNYRQQKKEIIIMKPVFDTRSGSRTVSSRVGISAEADVVITETTDLFSMDYTSISCVLVDEAQFLSSFHVKQLRNIASFKDVPVICYGLRTNYLGELFEGSYMLLCLADSIEEIKTTCNLCNRKAIMSLKLDREGHGTTEGGGAPELGFEDKYVPTCYKHYVESLGSVESRRGSREPVN
jgi:thymidine kinase